MKRFLLVIGLTLLAHPVLAHAGEVGADEAVAGSNGRLQVVIGAARLTRLVDKRRHRRVARSSRLRVYVLRRGVLDRAEMQDEEDQRPNHPGSGAFRGFADHCAMYSSVWS